MFVIKKFNELSNKELYQILQLRNKVFVVEQNCVYQDADGKDYDAYHIFIKENDKIIAYTRVFKPGDYFDQASIGRVVVDPKYRGNFLGKKIMQKSMDFVFNELNFYEILISAQVYLQKFYEDLGFKKISDEYLEDGIPHIKMLSTKQNLP